MSSPPGPDPTVAAGGARAPWLLRLAIALLLALIWLSFFELGAYERQRALEATATRATNLALALEQYTIRLLRNAEAVTQLVAAEHGRGARGATLQRVLQERAENNDALVEVLLLDAEGRVRQSSQASSLVPPAGVQVPAQAGTGGLVVGRPLAAHGDGRQLVPLLRAVREGGVLQAWAAVLVDSERFVGLVEQFRMREDILVVLVGGDGQVYGRWRNVQGASAPADPLAADFLAAAGSTTASTALDGTPRIIGQRNFAEYPLRAVVGMAEADALADHLRRRNRYFVAVVVVTLLVGVLTLAAAREARRRAQLALGLAAAKDHLAALNNNLELQVARRTAELQQANRDLESFSWSVAHDLRAPLAAIAGFSEALVPTVAAAGNDKHNHYLRRVRECAQQMEDITEGLLVLARIGRRPPEMLPLDLATPAHAVVAALREAQPARQVAVHIAPTLPATGDAALLRQLLENLIGNAWKFLRDTPHASIEVGLRAGEDGTPQYFVRDNGPGFDMKQAASLFKPFQRLHGEEFAGTGIGLATVRRIVELHGGRIWVEAAPGAGAMFCFTLQPAAGSGGELPACSPGAVAQGT